MFIYRETVGRDGQFTIACFRFAMSVRQRDLTDKRTDVVDIATLPMIPSDSDMHPPLEKQPSMRALVTPRHIVREAMGDKRDLTVAADDDKDAPAHWSVILPDSRFRRVWDPLQLVLLIYACVFSPYLTCFRLVPLEGYVAYYNLVHIVGHSIC